MNFGESYHSRIYKDFYELHHDSYDSVMRFYELNERLIENLPLEEQIELLAEYLNACFETAAYEKFIHHADDLIEASIYHNIVKIRGKDIYQETLFRKAASFFNIGDLHSATYIARELYSIDPQNPSYRLLIRKCRMADHSGIVRRLRNIALFLMLFTVLLIAFELLFVPHFFPEWGEGFNAIKIWVFVLAMGLIAAAELVVRLESTK